MSADLLYKQACGWLNRAKYVESAVLFGSSVRSRLSDGSGRSSDFDFHIVSSDISSFQTINWEREFSGEVLCLSSWRPATGGTVKATLVFSSGQMDMVIVSGKMMRMAQICYSLGLFRKPGRVRVALNEMATCLHSGYSFIKGASKWERFYGKIFQLPGVRLDDEEMKRLADASVCDAFWIFQKLRNGEIIAAQHVLHSRLVDVNLRLWRELSIRESRKVLSFGLGRHMERLAGPDYLRLFSIDTRFTATELGREVWSALTVLQKLMAKLEPNWCINQRMVMLLSRYSAEV